MITKEKAKKEIKNLIQRFLNDREKYEEMSETDVRNKLIDPLLENLGWDVDGKVIADEVLREQTVPKRESHKKKADYTFRIGVTKLVAEAKSLKEDLDNQTYIDQVIGYAYNLPCPWAVLTNFDTIKIFYVLEDTNYPFYKIILSDIKNFDENFETLWFISKQGVLDKFLDNEANKRGIRKERMPIDKQLLNNLKDWRSRLSKEIRDRYNNFTEDQIDEAVQRIIDRLIFIRKTEDLEYEERRLEQIVKTSKNTYQDVKKLFSEFNKKYNSKLFGESKDDTAICDSIELSDTVIESVIWQMYRPEARKPEYNFAVIDADVLGNIYEDYLAFILKKTPKGAKLKGGISHRKQEGIYYTPSYVVEYIVRNTLGRLLKEHKVKPENIRVLDMACGSGSFLLKAFDQINEYLVKKEGKDHQTRLDNNGLLYTRKVKILGNNIFGVDLDSKAVEIAQLNLLLKIAQGGERLPTLRNNIKVGNSLIDDKNVTAKAFDWNKEFSKIIPDGKFDVIIGNPPYIPIELFPKNDKEFYFKKYASAFRKFDTSILFIENGISLLKEGGLLSFIAPLTWQTGDNYLKFREMVFSQCDLKCVINLPFDVFPDAYVDTGIFILQKGKQKGSKFIAYSYDKKSHIQRIEDSEFDLIEQKLVESEPQEKVFTNKFLYSIQKKLSTNSIQLGEITDSCQGIVVSKFSIEHKQVNESYKPLLADGNGNRYKFEIEKINYINYTKAMNLFKYYSQPRIFVRRIINRQNRLMAFYYTKPLITKKDYNPFIVIDSKYDIKYLLGLLNSKLLSYVYIHSSTLALKDDFRQTTLSELRKLPIKKESRKEQEIIKELVDKIIQLNERLLQLKGMRTDESRKIEDEIIDTDNEIDKFVYKIYGLTEEEIEIIEKDFRR